MLSVVISVRYFDFIPLSLILMRAFLKTSIPIATDGHVESAQISILDSAPKKNFKIALVVFSVPYNTSVLSDLVFDEDDGTVTYEVVYTGLLYKIPCCHLIKVNIPLVTSTTQSVKFTCTMMCYFAHAAVCN